MLRVDRVGGGSECEMTHGPRRVPTAKLIKSAGHMIPINELSALGLARSVNGSLRRPQGQLERRTVPPLSAALINRHGECHRISLPSYSTAV